MDISCEQFWFTFTGIILLAMYQYSVAQPDPIDDVIEIPVQYTPTEIVVESSKTLWISLKVDSSKNSTSGLLEKVNLIPNWKPIPITVRTMNTQIVTVTNVNITFMELLDTVESNGTVQGFHVKGDLIGRSFAEIQIILDNPRIELFPSRIPVAVVREESGQMLTVIFIIVITCLSVVNNFMMGAQLDIQIIISVLKVPIGPVLGFCCQFILMPLLSFGWCFVFFPDNIGLQLGLFAVGCSPGGGGSNFWTIMLDGNIDLSVTMTFLSNFAAMAMMPFWFFTLGRVIFGGKVSIPFLNIIGGLAVLMIPAGLGLLFRMKFPEIAKKFKRIIKLTTLLILLFVYTFGIYANWFIWRLFTWRTVVAGMLLPWSAFTIAYVVCFLLRQSSKDCRTIAIETGIQNGGVAIILLQFSLPNPERDLSIVPPVCVLTFTAIPLWFILLYRTIQKRCNAKDVNEEPPTMAFSSGIVSTISNHFKKTLTETSDLSKTAYTNSGAVTDDDAL